MSAAATVTTRATTPKPVSAWFLVDALGVTAILVFLALWSFVNLTVGPLFATLGPQWGTTLVLASAVTSLVLAAPALLVLLVTGSMGRAAATGAAALVVGAGVLACAGLDARHALIEGRVSLPAAYAVDLAGLSLHASAVQLAPAAGVPDGRYFVATDRRLVVLTPIDQYGQGRSAVLPRKLLLAEVISDSPSCRAADVLGTCSAP